MTGINTVIYCASFAISLGPIFWLLNAEIYPLSVRSKAAGIGTMANWTFNFIVSLTFLLVPERKGKHLEDIQAEFQARVDRHSAASSAPAQPRQ